MRLPVPRLLPAVLLLFLLNFWAPAVLRAQEAPSPDTPPPPSKAPAQEEQVLHEDQTLKVNVNLVDVYFSARDYHGFIAGLRKDDCQLMEDNKPQVIKNLTQEKVPLTIVYVIFISDPHYQSGYGDMVQLTEQTGGRLVNVGHDGRKLEDAFDQIQDELRTQYLASYTPTNKEADGKFRKVEMDCGNGVKVQARKGYYAIVGGGDDANIE